MKLPALVHKSRFWGSAFLLWFISLWILSSRPLMGPKLPQDIPVDKILHFGYFFGGAGLLSATLFFQKGRARHWSTIHLWVVLALFLVGSLDEWHQSWYPFRSGNDAADLTADILGALAGTRLFQALQPQIFPALSRQSSTAQAGTQQEA